MQYMDYGIAKEKQNIWPVSLDAIYYVMADNKCLTRHDVTCDESVLIVSLSGSGTIRTKGKETGLNQGELLLLDARQEAVEYQCVNGGWNFWWFEFRCLDSEFPDFPQGNPLGTNLNENGFFLCEEALNHLKSKDVKTASCLFSSLLCLLAKECRETEETKNEMGMFRAAEQYILHNLATATVKSTAQYLNVSERTLLNLFQSVQGIRTVEYIQRRKIDEACRLLFFREKTIGEIAERLGYVDQFAFSKAFRKYMDISPSEYRKSKCVLKDVV